jgi:hypothetical protein
MAAAKLPPPVYDAPEAWAIYRLSPGLVLGFHGCDQSTADSVFGGKRLEPSVNDHDWLGNGVYFWESDPWRALAWACEAMASPSMVTRPIKKPAVIGAVLDLGRCFNLTEYAAVGELERAFEFLRKTFDDFAVELSDNRFGNDLVKRYRDKLVMDSVHALRVRERLPNYQSVRAAFLEGPPVYPNAGFRRKTHIQVAILDPQCIKGYFRLPGSPLMRAQRRH